MSTKNLTKETKNLYSGLAICLDDEDYADKRRIFEVLELLKSDIEREEVIKYLLSSTKTNFRLGLVYTEWAMKGFKGTQAGPIIVRIQLVGRGER